MIIPFTIQKLLGWAAISMVCTWAGTFGALYLRRRTFLVRKWTKITLLLFTWLLLIAATAASFRTDIFDYWMSLASAIIVALISMNQAVSQPVDLALFDIDPKGALEGLRASLREINLPFEEDGTGTFILVGLGAKITLKSSTWSASTDVHLVFPRKSSEKGVVIRHLGHMLSGRPYVKVPWVGLALLVVAAVGITFIIVV